MMKYRPIKRGKYTRRRINYKRLGTFIGIAAAAVVVVVLSVNMLGKAGEPKEPEATPTPSAGVNVFDQGVSVAGVSVSGMSMDQARAALAPVVDGMLNANKISFTVKTDNAGTAATGGDQSAEPSATAEGDNAETEATPAPTESAAQAAKEYSYGLEEMGATVDTLPVLEQAMQYRQTGETPVVQDFPLALAVDDAKLTAEIDQIANDEGWNIDPVNSKYKVETESSEENKTTYGKVVETETQKGYRVKTEDIASTIKQQLESGQFSTFEAPIEEVSAAADNEAAPMQKLASAVTSYGKSLTEKKYNIWKMSDIMNGRVIHPGESLSMNEVAGDRNEENGWWVALGIEDGNYTPQYGGGICQVSSTMYNAVLKAEMKVLNRVPHTIMSDYVKPGLDATISTGGPDFVFENPYDVPIYMIVNCSVPDNTVVVELWGAVERDYEVELFSELISDKEQKAPAPEIVVNSSLGPYDVDSVKPSRAYKQYQVYKRYIDKDTGNVIEGKDKIEVTTSTYNEIKGKIEVGDKVPYQEGMTLEEVRAAASKAAGDANQDSNQGDVENPTGSTPPTQSGGGGGGGGGGETNPPTNNPEPPTHNPEPPPSEEPPSEEPPAEEGGNESGGAETGDAASVQGTTIAFPQSRNASSAYGWKTA